MANKTIINEFTLQQAKDQGRIAFGTYERETTNSDGITEVEHFNTINWYPQGKKKVIFFAKSIASITVNDIKGHLDDFKVLEFDDCSLKLIRNTEIEL